MLPAGFLPMLSGYQILDGTSVYGCRIIPFFPPKQEDMYRIFLQSSFQDGYAFKFFSCLWWLWISQFSSFKKKAVDMHKGDGCMSKFYILNACKDLCHHLYTTN
jgi:hypothetical protein